MPKQATKSILAILKNAGHDLGDDRDKVTEALEDLELSPEEFLGSDQIILTKAEHIEPQRELREDLNKYKKRMKDAEAEAKELRDAMDSGDSDNVRKAKQYKTKLDELEPLVDRLLTAEKTRWEASAKSVPEEIRDKFKWPEKNAELSDQDLLHNVAKFEEYVSIGAIDPTKTVNGDVDKPPDEGPPSAPRIGGKTSPSKFTKEQLATMSPREMLDAHYGGK
jgi:hypothetical protein